MTHEEFNKKWNNKSVDDIDDTLIEEYIEDLYDLHESTGFRETFNSPYNYMQKYNGLAFNVVGRYGKEDCDYESMPMWLIRFNNGIEIEAFPEEICNEY